MGFGNFLANAGRGAQGAMAMAQTQSNLRTQEMQNEESATRLRVIQAKEAADREALARLRAPQAAPATQPQQASPFSYGSPAPATTIPVAQPVVAGTSAGKVAGKASAPLLDNGVDYHAGAVAYQNAAKASQAKLDALRASPNYQSSRDQRALVKGVVAPLAAAADVVTMPYNGIGMIAEQGVNAVNRVGNAVTGKPTFNTNNSGFMDRGATPYYDAHVRKTGRDNLNTPDEQKLIDEVASYNGAFKTANDQQIARLAKLKAGKQSSGASLADRNNNPLNLRGADQKFRQFNTADEGFAAADAQIARYASASPITGKPVTTVNDLVNTWAPPADNNKNNSAYIAAVSKALGVAPTDRINLADPRVRAAVIPAMARFEGFTGGSTGAQQPTQVATAAQPTQVASAPKAPAPYALQGEYNYQQNGAQSPEVQADAEAMRHAQIAMDTAPTADAYAGASAKLEALKINNYSNEVMRTGTLAASGDPQALNTLVGQFGSYHGQQFGVVPMSDGSYQMVKAGPDGKPIAMGMPNSAAGLANIITTNMVTSLRQASAARTSARQAEDDKNESKANADKNVNHAKADDEMAIKAMQQEQANYRQRVDSATKTAVARLVASGAKDIKTFTATSETGATVPYIISNGVVNKVVLGGETVDGFTSVDRMVPVGNLPPGATPVNTAGGDGVNTAMVAGYLNSPYDATAGLEQPTLAQ